jgi:uncharacterized phage-associated protein
MTVSAHDILRELQHRLGALPAVKSQKLLYYVQGWHLALDDRPAFREEIEAWDMGPVVADVWHDQDKGRPTPPPQEIDDTTAMVIDYVVARYGHLSGQNLITLTHSERPWKHAWAGRISPDDLKTFFSSDEQYEQHASEVCRLRDRLGSMELGPPAGEDLDAVIAAVLSGDRANDPRP